MIAPGIQDAYELSPVQAGMLFHAQLNPGTGVYVVQLWTRLSGRLDEAAFRDAWAWAAARHPALRTGFVYESVSKPLQVVHRAVEIPLQVLDWTGADEGEVERRMDALLREDRARGFVLSAPPLLRLTLVRLADQEHALVWSLHHLVMDGWSYTTLFREVLARYDARVQGTEFDPAASRSYKEFIGWLRGRDQGASEAFWRQALDGVTEPTPLGIDRGAHGDAADDFGDHNLYLPAEATVALHEAARAHRVTLATLIAGAWALVLSRYGGTEDVVFGSTAAGRPESLAGAERMCGLFVNTLPARVRVPAEAALGPWLREIQDRQVAAREHEHTPLVDVQGWTEVPRGRPLFESILAFENFPRLDGTGQGTGGLAVGRMRGVSSTGYPLTVLVHPGERMHLRAYQDRGRISDAAAERLLGHFGAALQGIANAPADATLHDVDILSTEERARLLGPWAGEARPYPALPVHHLVAEQAAIAPEKVAVTAVDGALTYAELEARANRLANHLVARGVRPGEIVGVALDRTAARVAALLGVVKAGAAYLPLDASYPPERLSFLLDDAGARLVVTDESVRPALPLEGRTAVSVDGDAAAIAAAAAEDPRVPVGADDPLYVVYTSGSTGTPKGVLIPHRALARLVRAADYADFGAEQVWMHHSALTFDTAPLEIWGALANGGRLAVLPPHPPTLDEIGGFIREQGVTTAWLTAGLFHQMADARLEDLGALRQLMAGGDVLSIPHVRRVMEAHPHLRIIDGYGPTENGTFTTTRVIQPEDLARPSIPVGRPVANTTVYVLDERMRPVPPGVPGELYSGGDGVALGYLNRPELTAERFVTLRLDGREERAYRIGDRVRFLEDGSLEFLGRMDQQVKVRGFRVEPGEVESVLCRHPAVRGAAVVARSDGAGANRLVAFIVGDIPVDEVRAFLAARLPEYMVPSSFVRMDALPLNRHGKVDRAALPGDDGAGADAAEFIAPRTETEELLAALWGEVLGADRVGVTEDFFARGGHSLQAMQLVTRVREALRVDVPLRALFEAPTVEQLAALLAADEDEAGRIDRVARLARLIRRMPDAEVRALLASTSGEAKGRTETARRQELLDTLLRAEGAVPSAEAGDAIVPRAEDGPAPLSFAQERLWVLDQMEPGSRAYTIGAGLRLRGALDVDALGRALNEIVRRHDALRTTFVRAEGGPVQVVAPAAEIDLPVLDLTPMPAGGREAWLATYVADEAAKPFDLAADALFRARLVRLGGEEHALILFFHHAVVDGWSLAVLYRELNALYAAFRRGEPSPLAPLAVQYPDFAVWQRAHLDAARLGAQAAWWRARLAGLPDALELPTDRPRPPVASQRGALLPLRIPAALADALRELSRREGTTLFMTLLAGFQALLHRYTGEADFAVGTPVAGRTRAETEPLIGLFVNTLVLRADLAGEPSFRDLLARVRETTLGAFAHQDVPFERLVDALQPERSLSYTPLFQVMFALQNAGELRPRLDGIAAERLPVASAGARCDLSWSLVETENGIEGLMEYATDLFDAATVERMLEHYRVLLASACADPAASIRRLPMVADAERTALLQLGAGATPDFPHAAVDALFAEHARNTPHAVAVEWWDGGQMTYAQLDAWANRLARLLRRHGVRPGTRVGMCLERGPAMIVTMVAILKAGGAYVPLDPAYPADRLAFMLADTDVPLLVTDARLAEGLPEHRARLVRVDVDADAIAAEPADALPASTGPESVAYVMYTSGSTGRPKGIEIPHRGIVRLVRGQDFVPMESTDVLLHVAPASFDASTPEVWGGLLNGARVALHPPEQPSVDSVERAVAAHGVTLLWLTAGLFHVVVDERLQSLKPVRHLLAGGDVLSLPHVRRVVEELPGTRLLNCYGPTENTTFTSTNPVAPLRADAGTVSIGRPIANTYVRVLDGEMQPVPLGVPGELFAGGAGLAVGYLNRPALTAEKFVPDPFTPGARLYRTGDRVRWLADGTLEFRGRIDTQVKIRGFRIEPAEIESVLSSHPRVRDSVVIVREDAPGDKRLVAYVVGDAEPAEVREFLGERLPGYMVPAAVVPLAALPRTPNDKVDRKALPAPVWGGEVGFVAPRTPAEQVLAGIWAQVLGVDAVGANDGFFALGGHSLGATRLASRVREIFGVEMPLRAVFEHPTLAALAKEIERLRAGGADALPPIVPIRRKGKLPLSFAQQRLWFLEQLEPGSPLYNVPVAIRLTGALDGPALARSIGEIVRRHEPLRTVFAGDGVTARQVIAPPADDFALAVEDLSAQPDPAGEAERRAREEAEAPFDLARGPLFRARLLRIAADEHVLLITLHHAVSDGWSMGVLFRELSALYKTYKSREESVLPPLPVQYADFAAWQRDALSGAALEAQLSYWKARLAGAPSALTLPTDHPRPAVQTYRGACERMVLPAEVAEVVKVAGRREGATLFMTLLAAYQALLSRHAGQDDVVVGSPIAGRTRGETEGLIGFFVNTLALRGDLSGDPAFRELLARVRETTLGAFAHQDLPFERLVEEVQPVRSLGHSPVFQAFFVLQDTADWGLEMDGLRAERLPVEETTVKFDLALTASDGADGLGLALYYNTALFAASTIRRMLDQLGLLLTAAAEDPSRRVSELPLLSEAERARMEGWHAGPPLTRELRLFPAQLAARVAEMPDAVAIVHGDARITYAQLDARSNRIANHLRRLGVGPEVRVGLCMERTPELVACVLGVLKAGGAYVPVEPWFPAERIAAVMRDSAVSVMIGASAALAGMELPAFTRPLRMDADEVRAALDAESPAAPEIGIHPESLFVVIYTSGSTGSPKGVMLTHENVGRFLDWMGERFPLAPGQVLLGSTSVAFDVHVAEMHFGLVSGASLLLVENALALVGLGPVDLAHASMVPTAARELLQLGALPGRIRRLNIAGEAPGADLGRALYAAGVPEVNVLYGPTEDTVYDTSYHIPRDVTRMLLGRPAHGRRAYVMDGRLNPVPAGVEGEIWLSGCGVTRGYLGRPGLTATIFVPHPLGAPGERLYFSGDRGRWTADGQLEFAGRADFQVKIRGFRIELGEIESLLRARPEVADAVVVAHGTESAKRLAAYVIPRAGEPVDAAALAGALRTRLPEYMVPSAFVAMDAFPRGSTGKLDRKSLPEPEFATEAAVYVEPATETERTVAEIFAAVLKIERAGATDDFFALGGHSLLGMHVWAHVRDRCGVQLALRALFEHPTVRALAAAVDAAPRAEAGAEDEVRVTARRRTVRAVRIAPVETERVDGIDGLVATEGVDVVAAIDAVEAVDADEPAGVGGD